jgi:hypothetical protein
MKNIVKVIFLSLIGLILITGCKKSTTIMNVPVNFTDGSGNIFIPIDTTTNSFKAYSSTIIKQGHLKAVFNDTIRAAFYLALQTKPYWDSVYHPGDTVRLSTRFPNHSLIVEADIDLTGMNSPYHFLIIALTPLHFKQTRSGFPNVIVSVLPKQN